MKNQSIYKKYSPEEQEHLLSNYLLSSWSYSKVTSFARNEKAFEMNYIFGIHSRSSATTVAGQAYHHALDYFFSQFKEGVQVDLIDLEKTAFEYIDEIPANYWKLQKTTPTIDDCKEKATKTVTALLRNFIGELSTYVGEIAEVLDVEVYCDEFLTVNGVDIPLPCHAKIDLVIRTKAGKVVAIDHKSKAAFTSEDEMALSIGLQGITYVKAYEEKTGLDVDEIWFVENKHSANKDKSPQLNKFVMELDSNNRRLYEALLYEPLKRMLEATSDPDYTYLINESDNYVDKAELYDFWARTMICEVEEFNVEESKKEMISKRLKKIRDASIATVTPAVIKSFKENASQFIQYDLSNKNMTHEEKIEHVLRSFGTTAQVAFKFEGFSSNTYLLAISAGVKVSSIHNKRLDIANALDVENVRISQNLVVHEGKSYLAIDFKKKRDRDLMYDPSLLKDRKIPIGVDNFGNTVVWDWDNPSTPHVLMCGGTGSGKSVCIKSIIAYAQEAQADDIIVFDPKFEFGDMRNEGIVVVQEILEIEQHMAKLVKYMNDLTRSGKKRTTLVVFDEFADAISNSRSGNELKIYEMVQDGLYANGSPKTKRVCTGEFLSLEENLQVLLQKGRSTGFRVVAAMQRASVKILNGDAKANLPVQICFKVPKEVDSKVVLDEAGAESLAGKGDGLIKSPEYDQTVRFQAFYKPTVKETVS